MEIKRSGYAGLLPAGVVVTGGSAETIGISQIGKEVLRMPVHIARPTGLTGLIDEISSQPILRWLERFIRFKS